MIPSPPTSKRPYTLLPYPTLFRSGRDLPPSAAERMKRSDLPWRLHRQCQARAASDTPYWPRRAGIDAAGAITPDCSICTPRRSKSGSTVAGSWRMDSDAKPGRKGRPPLGPGELDAMALSYVERYATSEEKLARYLRRKLRRSEEHTSDI